MTETDACTETPDKQTVVSK